MPDLVHTFEEVETVMPNGQTLWLSGKINVDYKMYGAEPDVGYMRDYAEWDATDDFLDCAGTDANDDDISVRLPVVYGHPVKDAPRATLPPAHQIILHCSDDIDQQCVDEASEDTREYEYDDRD